MLDLKRIMADPADAERRLKLRNPDATFDPIVSLAKERRAAIQAYDEARTKQKQLSSQFGRGDVPAEQWRPPGLS